jgi:hypothetical protein
MDGQFPRGLKSPNRTSLIHFTGWVIVASVIAEELLAAAIRRGWTHAPAGTPAVCGAVLVVYGWAFLAWNRWGERRRGQGRHSLIWTRSHVSATASSHSLLFKVVAGAAICLFGGFTISTYWPGSSFGIVSLTITAIALPGLLEQRHLHVETALVMLITYPALVLAGGLARYPGVSLLFPIASITLLVIAVWLLAWLVLWQAKQVWLAEQETESNAP